MLIFLAVVITRVAIERRTKSCFQTVGNGLLARACHDMLRKLAVLQYGHGR